MKKYPSLRAFQNLRIYLATSTKNLFIDDVLTAMREAGHEVYDFRASGRGPANIFDPTRKVWTAADYVAALASSIADQQYRADKAALDACDCVVLLGPCGNDAHSEAGYAYGHNIPVVVFLNPVIKPGLMDKFYNGFVTNTDELLFALSCVVPHDAEKTGDITANALDHWPIPSSRFA